MFSSKRRTESCPSHVGAPFSSELRRYTQEVRTIISVIVGISIERCFREDEWGSVTGMVRIPDVDGEYNMV